MSLFKDKLELEVEEAELEAQKTFSSFPRLYRWMLVIIAVALIPSYFVARSVSRGFWTSQYGKYILKAKAGFAVAAEPKISDITLFSQGSSTYAALVTVTNENLDLSLDETPFKVNFYNSTNNLVYTMSDKLFLLPNQKKDIVVPRFTAADNIVSAHLDLPKDLPWQKRAQLPKVSLMTSPPYYTFQYNPLSFSVEGNVYNNSPYGIGKVHLVFKVVTSAGKTVAVSQRDEFTLAPYERRAYKQLWPGMLATDIGSVTVTADTNTLDPQNLTLAQTSTTPASDLGRPDPNQYR